VNEESETPVIASKEEAGAATPQMPATIQSLPPESLQSPPSRPEGGSTAAPIAPSPDTALDLDSEALSSATRLQTFTASLLHLQTNTKIEIPQGLPVVHIGKPNEQIPPDIDVGGFPDSEIVSRIHADLRVEGDSYYLEDNGSSNGTYINHTPLPQGNRHRLRAGDRISLGKGDKVTFIFQLS
jgi:pSer/pThr/pTyr-binding forkhead associated (FHA) protein